jgi:hypothetical protein
MVRLAKRSEGGRVQPWGIAVTHQDVAVELLGKLLKRNPCRVAGATLFGLKREAQWVIRNSTAQGFSHRIRLMAHHRDNKLWPERSYCPQRPRNHRLAANLMQDFGLAGSHPPTESGGQDDCGERTPFAHDFLRNKASS